jgi:hypothetical protein
MQCTCGWKKPLVCVVSVERDVAARLLVAVTCPECKVIYDASEQDMEEVSDETIRAVGKFVEKKLREKLADA